MKVLIISHMYPSSFNEVKGIFVHQQVKELINQGLEVKVVSPVPWTPFPIKFFSEKWKRYSYIPEKSRWENVDVFYPRYLEFPRAMFFAASGRRMLNGIKKAVGEIYKNFNFDIIHSHMALPDGFAGMRISQKYRTPLFVTIHGQDFQHTIFNNKKCKKNIEKVVNSSVTTIVVSNKLKKIAGDELNIDTGKLKAILNGISPRDIFNRKTEISDKYKERTIILSVSNLIETKGVDLNIKALAMLKKKFPKLIYLIAGRGVERKSLEELVRVSDVEDNVEFLGALNHNKVMEYMSICDIFSLPSWNEAFGVVYLEAMANGKPAIACKGEGIEGIVKDKETGILVKPKDVGSLVKAIEFLLLNTEKAGEIGQEAKRVVLKNYLWEESVKKLIRIYKETLGT